MLNLNGIVPVETIHELDAYTSLRLRDKMQFVTAEALGLYEQKLLPNDEIFALCEEASGKDLYIPLTSYIPDDLVAQFRGSKIVPVSFSPMRSIITCVALPELGTDHMPPQGYSVDIVYTTIYNYFEEYIKQFGQHPALLEVPAKQLLDSIVNEAIAIDAADITISSKGRAANVYYNVRKKKVESQRILTGDNLESIIKILCIQSPMDNTTNKPKYVGVSLNDFYRGRVVINHKYKGFAITMRLLPNAAFNKRFEDLHLTKETIAFIRTYMMNRELGLRLIVGSTMSGKNTTALALLGEYTNRYEVKVVSVEMPVEQELHGIEQINCEDEDEYDANINSLIRQNPDFIYLTEVGDTTATSVMRVTNTGKKILSTLHCNGVSAVVGRIQDITQLSTDRIIQSLHSVIYQELVRDEETDTVSPKCRFVYFSQERKAALYGKSYGEVILKIKEWEGGDVW